MHDNPLRLGPFELRWWTDDFVVGPGPPARWCSLCFRHRPAALVLKRAHIGRRLVYVLWVNR